MLDLDQFETVDEIDVELKGPDRRTPLGLTIRVAGPDSSRQRAATDAITNERLADESAEPLTAEDIRQRTLDVLVKATVSWTPNPVVGGAELECNEANARKVYTRYPFILDQVRAKAENRAAFTKGSATTSSEP